MWFTPPNLLTGARVLAVPAMVADGSQRDAGHIGSVMLCAVSREVPLAVTSS